jgi:hypothetical protein
MQNFYGEYKITIEGKCPNKDSVKKKDEDYESNKYIDWIKTACEAEINGKIKVEKINATFKKDKDE